VNDGPDADVKALLNELIPIHHNLRIVHFDASTKQTGGKKEPLAAGISKAKYDWLLLTDSDCVVGPEWIQSMMNCASGRKPVVLGNGPLEPGAGLVNVMSGFDNTMIAIQYMSFALKGWPYMGVGRNLLYHKKVYAKANGFQDHIDLASGDDDLFVQRVANRDNVALNLDARSFVYSPAKSIWGALISQKRRHVSTSKRYKWKLKVRIGLTGLSFIVMWLGGVIIATQADAVPVVLFVMAAVVQWAVFALIARHLRSRGEGHRTMERYIPLYPLWAILYALFLSLIGIIALFGRPPKSWNPS
jgi:poly-beta-1,6-N-acetyl-D-glucosamine synthase